MRRQPTQVGVELRQRVEDMTTKRRAVALATNDWTCRRCKCTITVVVNPFAAQAPDKLWCPCPGAPGSGKARCGGSLKIVGAH